jgi:hypothetical protein
MKRGPVSDILNNEAFCEKDDVVNRLEPMIMSDRQFAIP